MAKSEATAAEKPAEKNIVEFVPFGTKDKISLTIEIVKRLIAVKTKQGKTCSDEDAFKFMLMCQARKLNPFEGDAYLIGYDSQAGPSFSLITAHQAFLKRAELHEEFDGMESGTIVQREGKVIDLVGDWHMPNDSILGGWATVFFKHRAHPMTKRVRLARFNKNYGIWRDDPAGMIVKCAEADALRSSFPTMLGGMYITEESMTATGEIARPVFQDNGEPQAETKTEKTVRAEVIEQQPAKTEPAKPEAARVETPKKKAPPGLARKTPARSTSTEEVTPHARLASMLAVGNCTPKEFIALAIDEGWLEADQGVFDKIPAERVVEFMKDENWAYIMQALEERAAKRQTTVAQGRGELL
jgi:phage recombination protein Bet